MCVREVICREGGTPSSAAGRRRLPARRPPSQTPRHNGFSPLLAAISLLHIYMGEGVIGEGEEEEEDLFVFNDTIEGPRAPAVKPGRVTQA